MRRISLDMVRPGMILGKAILGGNGQVLLNAGVEIKPQYIIYLKSLGIEHVYVKDSRVDDVAVKDVIKEETRQEARVMVKNIMQNIKSPGEKTKSINIDDKKVLQKVNTIIEELLENKDMVVQLSDIRAKSDYLFAHSVNCTVLATLVAIKMNYNHVNLRHLATGTMLHDLGMITVPENIVNKPAELTEDERETVQTHSLYGFEIFKKTLMFDARAGIVILQHHERIHGQGYPDGLSGDKIHQSAQIVGIVDVYDALTSERPFRKAYPPYRAIEMLMSWGGEFFNLEILQHFLSVVAAYPFGSHVYLSNGDSGLVITNNPGLTLHPVVRVLYQGRDLAPHPSPYDIDLSQSLDLTITDVLD